MQICFNDVLFGVIIFYFNTKTLICGYVEELRKISITYKEEHEVPEQIINKDNDNSIICNVTTV